MNGHLTLSTARSDPPTGQEDAEAHSLGIKLQNCLLDPDISSTAVHFLHVYMFLLFSIVIHCISYISSILIF